MSALSKNSIVAFDNQTVGGIDDLHKLLTAERIKQKLSLIIFRRTGKLILEVIPEAARNGQNGQSGTSR